MSLSVTNDTFDRMIMQADRPVILDVYATWCPPCQEMLPIFEEVERELGDTYCFAKMNVDHAREKAIELGVSSIPTFFFIKDGQIKGKEVRTMSAQELKKKIESYFAQ